MRGSMGIGMPAPAQRSARLGLNFSLCHLVGPLGFEEQAGIGCFDDEIRFVVLSVPVFDAELPRCRFHPLDDLGVVFQQLGKTPLTIH